MVPNLVIETHHGGGVVTTQPAPKNKFFLGKVSSDPDSLVAMRSDRALVRVCYLITKINDATDMTPRWYDHAQKQKFMPLFTSSENLGRCLCLEIQNYWFQIEI